MFDLSTLSFLAAALFAAIAGDAVVAPNKMNLRVHVPAAIVSAGITRDVAESIFLDTASRYASVQSVVPMPEIQVSSQKTLIGTLIEPLKLGDVRTAMQDTLGLQPLRVAGSIVEDGPGLRLVVSIAPRNELPRAIEVTRPDRDAVALLRDGASRVIEDISPFRVALFRFAEGYRNGRTEFEDVREVLKRELARPLVLERVDQRAALISLDGVIAAVGGDWPRARARFAEARATHGIGRATAAIFDMNLAFAELLSGETERAVTRADLARGDATRFHRELGGLAETLAGLADWQAGRLEEAQVHFERAVALDGSDHLSDHYLADVIELRGLEPERAARVRADALAEAQTSVPFPAVVHSLFLYDVATRRAVRRLP